MLHFSAPLNKALSSFQFISTSKSLAPAKSYITMPAVTVGEIPNSISVPLLDARITLSQQKGSADAVETIPYKGIWQQIRYINVAITVHISLCLNLTFVYVFIRK